MKIAMWLWFGAAGWVVTLVLAIVMSYNDHQKQTAVKDTQHDIRCRELRAEFFSECQKTAASRQQCEALYGQTDGVLWDGPPELAFVKEYRCEPEP